MTPKEFQDAVAPHMDTSWTLVDLWTACGWTSGSVDRMAKQDKELAEVIRRTKLQVRENRKAHRKDVKRDQMQQLRDLLFERAKGHTKYKELLASVGLTYESFMQVTRFYPDIRAEIGQIIEKNKKEMIHVKWREFANEVLDNVGDSCSIRATIQKMGHNPQKYRYILTRFPDIYEQIKEKIEYNKLRKDRIRKQKAWEEAKGQNKDETFNNWGDWFYAGGSL